MHPAAQGTALMLLTFTASLPTPRCLQEALLTFCLLEGQGISSCCSSHSHMLGVIPGINTTQIPTQQAVPVVLPDIP